MGKFGLVVAFSIGLWVLHNRQSVLDADGAAQASDGHGAAEKVAELPITFYIDRRPDDVIYGYAIYQTG